MSKALTLEDLQPSVQKKIKTKEYSATFSIEGVRLISLENYVEEDGDFSELIRISNGSIEGIDDFSVAQLNRTRINPQAIKAWHLHLKQAMLWYVCPEDLLFVGLWDIRKQSKTTDKTIRIMLGGGKSQLLFIPNGVAHGSANFSMTPVNLFYFTNQRFNIKNMDEKRLPWDARGRDFWLPRKD